MEQLISMDKFQFAVVCSPFCLAATLLNIFFFFCVCRPAQGVNIRQPLRFLLAAQLCNSTVQQLVVMISVVLAFMAVPSMLLVANVAITFQTYCSSFSTSAWISLFYYMTIVPQHSAAFIRIKKHIKVVVIAGFFFDQLLLLSALSMGALAYLHTTPEANSTSSSLHATEVEGPGVANKSLFKLATRVFLLYFVFPICSLSVAWGRTFVYLRTHIRRMKESTGSSSSPQQKNQMRVTVMGIVQTALFVPGSLLAMTMALLFGSPLYEQVDYDKHITMTVSSVSGLANILCLGFSQSTLVRSDTDVGREGLALSLHSNPSQRCSIGWRSGLCAGRSSSSTPDSLIHVFMELALCTGVRSCWNRKGPSPNCPHNVRRMEWSRVSWSAEAFRVPLTGTKGRSLTPEHPPPPHTIIPPPPNSPLGTVQADQYRSPGTTKPRLVHRMARRRSVIGHSREHASTALESRGGALHHCVPRSALRLVM
ncbi:hypothetical protein NFI96_029732 [Prochilodus magdalenae]|nr:hypothetical protein NFI96_029732 [Prochilodus magdalenae]